MCFPIYEGPQVISWHAPVLPQGALKVGMITSIEPGIYRPGKWGIRILYIIYGTKEENMYRVIEMYGDFEPWWFLDGWENDIIQEQRFEKYYNALKFYKIRWLKLETEFKEYKSRSDLMTVFWNEKDQRWCEECDDYVQQYRSIILLEDEKVIPRSKYRPGYAKQNGLEKHRSCRIK